MRTQRVIAKFYIHTFLLESDVVEGSRAFFNSSISHHFFVQVCKFSSANLRLPKIFVGIADLSLWRSGADLRLRLREYPTPESTSLGFLTHEPLGEGGGLA